MARHQYGIFAEGTRSHHHLEFELLTGVGAEALRAALTAVRAANADHRTNGGTNLVVGFGPATSALLGLAPVSPFEGYASPDGRHRAPGTQRDVWVWVHGPTPDVLLDVVRPVTAALAEVATLVLDLPGFVYHDSRDLTGFIDGSANPFLDEAPLVAVVPDGEPGEGSCLAMTMRFEHHLDRFDALDVADQEAVFGRTKPDSVELDDKPPTAHISRVEVDGDDGEELKVYRRSVPWATAARQGLHFVSFGLDTERFDLQLRHQYGLVDDGVTDRLLEFTTPDTGSFWRCPSIEDLDRIAPLPDDDD
jgi:putative iron-dependent peroxidase